MHWTLPPLLGRWERSALERRVAGNAAADLSPVKGATMLACAGAVRDTVAVEAIMDEAISLSLSLPKLPFLSPTST